MGGCCTPALAMVFVQVGFAGLNVVSKLALDDGMSPYVMIAYRQIFATLFISPIAFFLERKTRMAISGKIIFQVFLCSFFGATMNQLLYVIGLKYSTPTIASALNNILPAITFIMAVPFRMETIGIRTLAGQAKVIGTVLCVGGSMEMTFYKGSLIKIWSSHIHWRYAENMTSSSGSDGGQNMALGAALVIASCITWAIWFIIQAKMSESFSSPYTSSALMCFMAAIQCLVVGAGMERKLSEWRLGWDIRLIASLYLGMVGSALAVSLMSWCIEKKGPLYVSTFSPLQLVVVAVLGWAILDEKLYVGSVTGSILIVVGLYLVIWGKRRELKKPSNIGGENMEEELEEGGGSTAANSMPMYCSPGHEGRDSQPQDSGVKVSDGSPN